VTGPVQVLVVGFDTPTFSGEVLAELDQLRRAGIVKLLDLLLVRRDEAGSIETVDLPESVTTAGLGELALALFSAPSSAGASAPADADADGDDGSDDGGDDGGDDGDDGDGGGSGADTARTWSLEAAVPPGTTAAVALIEHVWARPLREAIKHAGGHTLEETWLGARDLDTLEGLLAGRSH